MTNPTPAPDELDEIIARYDYICGNTSSPQYIDKWDGWIKDNEWDLKPALLAYVDKRERLARQEGVKRGAEIANEEWLKFADFVQKGISALSNSKGGW